MIYDIDVHALQSTGMSVVKDRHGTVRYILNGRHGIANDRFYLSTVAGDELGSLRQVGVGFFPKYVLTINQQDVAQIKKMFGMWTEVVYVSELNWLVIGNLLANRYRIYHGVTKVTTIANVNPTNPSVIELNIQQPDYVVPALLIAAILDRWRQVNQGNPLTRRTVDVSFG